MLLQKNLSEIVIKSIELYNKNNLIIFNNPIIVGNSGNKYTKLVYKFEIFFPNFVRPNNPDKILYHWLVCIKTCSSKIAFAFFEEQQKKWQKNDLI